MGTSIGKREGTVAAHPVTKVAHLMKMIGGRKMFKEERVTDGLNFSPQDRCLLLLSVIARL